MKMRWKWLLLLSLISISLVVAASDEDVKSETENVEVINNDGDNSNKDDDINYDENEEEEKVQEDKIEEKQEEKPDDVPIQALNSPVDIAPADVDEVNEDIVDVEEIKPQKTKGKYMNYEDYGAFNLDIGDQSYDWNNPNNRIAPNEPPTHRNDGRGYTITHERLRQIRSNFMYWFFDKGGPENSGDLQRDIHASNQQVHKNFNFQLPFFGFRFNYTRVSMNGYLEFSDPPEHYTYPLVFPIKDWPRRNDPSFIGIFFSRCRIGRIYQTDWDQRVPGVYFRQERDLMTRTDRFGIEVRERVMWDIREGVVGSDTFVPKHVVILTWKNMSFAGGIDNSLFRTNSFQMVLATDEVYTYAIFNYADISWSSHTEAGGDTTGGEGGVPAYIGFNAGNGTQSYEYKPYSQASVLRDLTGRGWANGFPGRHIFRIDERIMLGTCNKDIDAANLPLVFAPESGNMLGGTIINITGPCFMPGERIECMFDTEPIPVVGHYVDRNRAICIQPSLKVQGYVRLAIRIGTEPFKWRGWFFVETPATSTERIFFEDSSVHQRSPPEIRISWNRFNLTSNFNAPIRISLYGYRESTIRPELEFIDIIEEQLTNTGIYTITPSHYRTRHNPNNTDMQFGFLQIRLVNPEDFNGLQISPTLWSKPIPLAWYFGPQWERIHGLNWPRALCDNWMRLDRFLRNFAHEVPICPCKLDQALYDKGRFMPDFDCDRDTNPTCLHHRGGIHCVRSGTPTSQGSEQQCCYDRNGFLMLSHDQMWGSRPRRTHNIGQFPYNEANKVPTLSQWFHDIRPYYSCCRWQDEQAVGCETFRFERRPSQDCVAYQSPGVASIFGDPHIVTFDGLEYTFNGMGEFVLVRAKNGAEELDVQARFQQVPRNIHGQVMATHPTSIAVRGHNSTVIEVRVRPRDAQWRYRLDVFADGRRVFFDRFSLKYQFFHGVTVYTPSYILNQSEVVIMFPSGAGVEVVENAGFMTARVYLPWGFINKTRGLFGNWSFDIADDFTRPDGTVAQINLNNFEGVHRDFAIRWMLSDRETDGVGAGLFTREFGRTASYYANITFLPNFIREPRDFLPANRSIDIEMAHQLCGESYQCRYDYGMTLNREMAHFTRNYYDSAVNIQRSNQVRVLSCGILETPRFGRKSNFQFTPGAVITFECNEGFFLKGDRRRICGLDGNWDLPEYGYTECLREQEITARTAGFSTFIIISTFVPLLLLIIIIIYRHVQKKQQEIEEKAKLFHFEEVERERQNILDKMQKDYEKREKEIHEYLDNKLREEERPSTSGLSKKTDAPKILNLDSDEGTDDEFFEMPLPPVPSKSPRSAVSGQLSIIDNEAMDLDTPSVKSARFTTPKLQNISSSFKFPSPPKRYAPPPPLNLESNYESVQSAPSPPEPENFSPTSVNVEAVVHSSIPDETAPPIPDEPSPRKSSAPVIIEMTPKSLLQSDF